MRLTNGLTVIFEHNPAVDVASIQIGVKAGSVNEADSESGMCHLIEHMVFKGTKSYKPGEIAVIAESAGGEINAYTSLDQTVYYVTLPAKSFALGLNILKEMVFDAAFDGVELAREKEVVIEEIRRGKDSPQRVLGETLFEAFFEAHPYRRPVIGTEELVRGFTREAIKGFYKRWYRPQNMVVALCGNVAEGDFNAELERLFRFEIPSPEVFSPCPAEPPRTAHKVVTRTMDIQGTFFDAAFSAPDIHSDDVPALDVLSHLLGEGDTSLLVQNTKERERLVHSIYSSSFTPRHPGMFVIGGMVDAGKLDDALLSIRGQIERARFEPFPEANLARVKTMLRTQLVFDKETCEGTARKWITYETVAGDHLYDEKYLERVAELAPEDVRRAAEKYLDTKTAVLAVLHPLKVRPKLRGGFFAQSLKGKKPARARQNRGVYLYRLDNGLRLVVRPNRRLPIASLRLTALGGQRAEPPRDDGISNLIAHTLVKGTTSLNQLQIAERCEALAANLAGYAGRNSWGMSFSLLSARLAEGFPLFADVVRNPAFAGDEVDKEKALQIEAIKNRRDNPAQTAFAGAMRTLFKGHPLSRHLLGEIPTVKRFTPEGLRRFYGRLQLPSNMVLSVSGDVEPEVFFEMAKEAFGNAPKGRAPTPHLPVPKPPQRRIETFSPLDRKQAHVVVGFVTASLYDKDRYVLDVINSLLSGQGGRLFLELRDRQSLAYSVSSTITEGLDTGFFGVYIAAEPAKVPTALAGIFKELERLRKTPADAGEVERARNYIIGNHEIECQKNGAVAMQLALHELYGTGIGEFFDFTRRVGKVSAEDVRRVANRYFDPGRCVVSRAGPKNS